MTYDIAGAIHMHSDYSHDGVDSLESLREACVARGIRWVGLTDHAEDFETDVFAEYSAHCASLSDELVSFIPGLEYRFAGFRGIHLFAIGVNEWICPRTPDEFFLQTNEVGAFTVLAHPIICRYAPPQIVLDHVDGIEVWNTRYNGRYLADPDAISLYKTVRQKRPAVVGTVGLDQHDSAIDGGVRTLVSADDLGDPVAALKAGRFRSSGRNTGFDSTPTLSASQMRQLRIKRFAMDFLIGWRRRMSVAALGWSVPA
jgi:hypothetical protein